jgi:copper chaperone CopZ
MPPTPTRPPLPTATLASNQLSTFNVRLAFDTYETEETVQLQLGRLPGVTSVSVTQLDVTVQYDPTRLSEEDIMRTLRANPEVKIKD